MPRMNAAACVVGGVGGWWTIINHAAHECSSLCGGGCRGEGDNHAAHECSSLCDGGWTTMLRMNAAACVVGGVGGGG